MLLLQPLPVSLARPLRHLFYECKRRMVAAVDLVEERVSFVLLLYGRVELDITPYVVD